MQSRCVNGKQKRAVEIIPGQGHMDEADATVLYKLKYGSQNKMLTVLVF